MGTLGITFKTFASILTPRFISTYNSVLDVLKLPADSLTAHIAVIPKEGKNSTVCVNYRLISLLNTGLQILTKIPSTCLLQFILYLVQEGFMPSRDVTHNTTSVSNVIHLAHILKITMCF